MTIDHPINNRYSPNHESPPPSANHAPKMATELKNENDVPKINEKYVPDDSFFLDPVERKLTYNQTV